MRAGSEKLYIIALHNEHYDARYTQYTHSTNSSTIAVARHMSIAQITCLALTTMTIKMLMK